LDRALAAVRDAANHLPVSPGDPPPQILETLPPLLTELRFDTLDDYEEGHKSVGRAVLFAQTWAAQARQVSLDTSWRDRLVDQVENNEPLKIKLGEASAELAMATHGLRSAGTAEDLTTHETAKHIITAEHALAEISDSLRRGVQAFDIQGNVMRWDRVESALIDPRTSIGIPKRPPPDDHATRLAYYRRKQTQWDWGMTAFAFLIALLTGLQKLYFDKPFGTLADYVALFLLALGTRAATETLSVALEWMTRPASRQSDVVL
jgi:hypothetical protein